MGWSDKKSTQNSKTTQNTSNTSTSTPNVPDWIADPSKTIAGNVSGFLKQGPDAYTPQTSGLQQQAFDAAGGLKSSPYFSQAGDALGAVGNVSADQVTGASLLDNGLDRYYNPFKDQVLNPVLNDYDFQSGQTRAAQAAQGAQGRAFQGSRYGIREGETEGALARGRASTEGTLLNQMYGSATGLADQDAARRQAAAIANQGANLQAGMANQSTGLQRASQLAGLATSQGADARANLGVQAGLGGVLTDQENAARQYPLEFQRQQEGLLQGLDPSLYTGKTLNSTGSMTGTEDSQSKTAPSTAQQWGQAAQIAAMFL